MLTRDAEGIVPNGATPILLMPPEVIIEILCHLSMADIVSVSLTCRALHVHTISDVIWRRLVQESTPGNNITSPHPFKSFRELYACYEHLWFLPKNKLFFADRDMAGRLIIIRYDQRFGVIEGLQLVAVNTHRADTEVQFWGPDRTIMLGKFAPKVELHGEGPILRISRDIHNPCWEERKYMRRHWLAYPEENWARGKKRAPYQPVVHMTVGASSVLRADLFLVKEAPPDANLGLVWPPLSIPAATRALGHQHMDDTFDTRPHQLMDDTFDTIPFKPDQIFPGAFRLRRWIELYMGINHFHQLDMEPEPTAQDNAPAPAGVHFGEELATFGTIDPAMYKPTPEKPYRGIWVGDYGPNGCEFLFFHQPDMDEQEEAEYMDSVFARQAGEETEIDVKLRKLRMWTRHHPERLMRGPHESDERFAQRKEAVTVVGPLHAVKLTGDPHVPRGEYSFVTFDVGNTEEQYVADEPPFEGVRVVRAQGQVARHGFVNSKWYTRPLVLSG